MNELSEDQVKIQAAASAGTATFLVYASVPAQTNTHVVPMFISAPSDDFVTYVVITQPLMSDAAGTAVAPVSYIPPQDSGQGPTGWSLGDWRIATFGSFGEAVAFYAGNTTYAIPGTPSSVQLSEQQRATAMLLSTVVPDPVSGPPRAYVVLYQVMTVHVVSP